MDRSFIEALSNLAAGAYSGLTGQYSLYHKDMVVHDLEKYKDKPDFFRANFETSIIDDFCNYVNFNAKSSSGLFINHLEGKAKIILDMGYVAEPEWGRHVARLSLRQTPEYIAIERFNDKTMEQQGFIDFLEDYAESIMFVEDNLEPMDLKQSIAKFRKLKIDATNTKTSDIGNYSHHASAIEAIEIKADNEAPPPKMEFTFIPHEGFEPISIYASIRAFSDSKKVMLKYRIIGMDLAKKKIADELIDKLVDGISITGLQRYIGEMNYQ